MKFGQVNCANEDCKKCLGCFPEDNVPKEGLELYCEDCKEKLEKQEE